MELDSTECHLQARVTAEYIRARPLDEDSEDLELQDFDSELDEMEQIGDHVNDF